MRRGEAARVQRARAAARARRGRPEGRGARRAALRARLLGRRAARLREPRGHPPPRQARSGARSVARRELYEKACAGASRSRAPARRGSTSRRGRELQRRARGELLRQGVRPRRSGGLRGPRHLLRARHGRRPATRRGRGSSSSARARAARASACKGLGDSAARRRSRRRRAAFYRRSCDLGYAGAAATWATRWSAGGASRAIARGPRAPTPGMQGGVRVGVPAARRAEGEAVMRRRRRLASLLHGHGRALLARWPQRVEAARVAGREPVKVAPGGRAPAAAAMLQVCAPSAWTSRRDG